VTSSPPAVEEALEQRRGREPIYLSFAPPGRPSHFPHGTQRSRGRHALVDHDRGKAGVLSEKGRNVTRFVRAGALAAVTFEGESNHDPDRPMAIEMVPKLLEREPLAHAPRQRVHGVRKQLCRVGGREADPLVAKVDREQTARSWESCRRIVAPSVRRRHPSCMVA
jgi:hypothetical protein